MEIHRTFQKATLQSTTSSASAAVKHVAILRNLCPDDVDVERAAASILGKLVALELVSLLLCYMVQLLTFFGVKFDLATTVLTEMHHALCRLINLETDSQDLLHLLSIPIPSSFPTNPLVLTLISTYLLHALIIATRQEITTINALATTLNSPNSTSLLAWVPSLTSLPTKHMDSLLTRAYMLNVERSGLTGTVLWPLIKKGKVFWVSVNTGWNLQSVSVMSFVLRTISHIL